ncbi:MAG: COQ9 family protein [Alphaproteobacteria bacterium]|nr:COQ9 family protein [Alphaproteobacteria bacterium]
MDLDIQDIKDRILRAALADVPFDGWQWSVIETAAQKCGFEADMAEAVFPEKIQSVLTHFSAWADREMLQKLEPVKIEDMRVRDRVHMAVMRRIEVLTPHKEAVRACSGFWFKPMHKMTGGKIVWATADQIWNWAGDTATDYNHYTKRLLLSGVIISTMLAWLADETGDLKATEAFLARRIENVLKLGGRAGKVIGRVQHLWPFREKKTG